MPDTVFLRRARGAEGVFEWLVSGEAADAGAVRRGSLAEAAEACSGARTVFLAPGEDVLLTSVDIPARNRQRMLQALPYALEDRLAQDIEEMHFAPGVRRGDGSLPVAVVERARLEGWLAELRAVGIEPDRVVPDVLAVPYEPGTWTALDDDGMALVRTTTQGGFAIDLDSLAPVLAGALEEAGEDRPARLLAHAPEGRMGELEALATLGLEVVPRPLPGPALALMAGHAEGGEAIELLQGDYNRREQFGRTYRPWLPAAAALVLLVLLNAVVLIYDYVTLNRESARLQAAIEGAYREAFPEAQRVVNPRVQMERGLEAMRRGGSAGGGFLDIMRSTAPVLRQTEGLSVQRVSYRENRLDLALQIRDLQNLDGLVQRITEEGGLEVDIQSASAVEGRIEARLQVRAAP